ncbi:MAG: FecR domain-containing protein, partial [Bacteroidales bacterium]|nr:FecR domain-containing protein [Bacteroidales bacterium]
EETHSDFNSLVTRYLSGELSPEEDRRFQEMLNQDPEKQSRVEEYRKIWESVGSKTEEKPYNLDAEWDLIRKKLPGIDAGRNSSRSLLFYTYRIAASLVVGLLFVFAWIYATRLAGTEQVVAENIPVEALLDDGTHVTVNRDSRIRYKKKFAESERRIFLAGEAWFDVSRDTSRPFIIDAGSAMVEVLGTSFNVNAYKENSIVEITVKSGVVALTAKVDQQEQIVLRAGNSGTYNKNNNELKLIPSSNPNKISWKTRELYFDSSSLEEVTELVNSVYNTNLVIVNQELASCPITVTFRNQTLEAVLNVLELTLDLEITRSGDEIRLDGPGCED